MYSTDVYQTEKCDCAGTPPKNLELILKDAGVVRCKKCGRIWTEKDRNLVDDLPCDLGPVVFPTDAEQHTRATMTLTMFDALIRRFREELEASDADAAIMEHLKKMDDTVTALADSIRKKHLSVRAKKAFDEFVDLAGSLYTLPDNGYDRLKSWVALFCGRHHALRCARALSEICEATRMAGSVRPV